MRYKHALFLNPYIEASANSTMSTSSGQRTPSAITVMYFMNPPRRIAVRLSNGKLMAAKPLSNAPMHFGNNNLLTM